MPRRVSRSMLEKKRTSITRLKLSTLSVLPILTRFVLKRKEPRLRDWNSEPVDPWCPRSRESWKEKNLDYEIETLNFRLFRRISTASGSRLEKKRTSITRLKRREHRTAKTRHLDLKRKEPRLRDWNLCASRWVHRVLRSTWKEKNLDYEIETSFSHSINSPIDTWKEKNLDYEIETVHISRRTEK